ncbi:cytochrome c [Brevundimonas sp.]|uniref:c-type cytochrome n=1 Tax=Brevundimonas sp. TaxID=1871086 RepID=UPI002D34479F|nr:cytochrome c [Brevundimonas sp.]HYD27687.1 cytochrome c [Brevundimonas sp.]
MFMHRFGPGALAALTLGAAACAGQPPSSPASASPASASPDAAMDAAARGQRIAARTCANCHSVGPVGASPMAEATPFREIAHRYPLDQLEEAFAEGLVTSHPAMPAFVFRASEIDDLIAYLETVKAEQ